MKRFAKGSQEAKDYMASIRAMKKKSDMPMMPKKKSPAKARAMKGSDEAKAMMAKIRAMKKK